MKEERRASLLGQAKGGHSGLLPRKTMCPHPEGFDEELYDSTSQDGVADQTGGVCAGSQVVGLLILMSFSGPFNLVSGGWSPNLDELLWSL